MQRRQRLNEERRRQLWLLLLVPWLWLSGFSEAMHHHALFEGTPASVVVASSAVTPSHVASTGASHQAAVADTFCAICQWQHSNQSHTCVVVPLSPRVEVVAVAPSYLLALLSRDSAISRSRGPPSC